MPFANLSRHPADEWIGAGIAETVSVDLTRVGLTLVEQTAVLGAIGTRDTVDRERVDDTRALEIGRQLGATLLVRGTYQRVGDRLRITAHVVDVRSGSVVHSAKIDGSLSDVFAAQDQIVLALAERLAPSPDRAPGSAVRRAPAPPALERRAAAPEGTLVPADVTGGLALPTAAAEDPPSAAAPGRRGGGGFAITNRPMAIAVRTSQPPAIDGRLDDPVWRGVTPITQFVQTSPVEGAAATEATEVWLAYDSDNLYLAFYAHYADPGIIRANRAERDSGGGDDQMSVLFDPFLDQQRAYMFSVNGYGVPSDAIVNAAGGGSSRSRSSVGRSSSDSSRGSSSSGGGRGGGGGGGPGSSGSGIRGDRSWDALFDVRAGLVDDGWDRGNGDSVQEPAVSVAGHRPAPSVGTSAYSYYPRQVGVARLVTGLPRHRRSADADGSLGGLDRPVDESQSRDPADLHGRTDGFAQHDRRPLSRGRSDRPDGGRHQVWRGRRISRWISPTTQIFPRSSLTARRSR